MKNLLYLLVGLLAPTLLSAQITVNYDDVGIIINTNSQTSIDIGDYFQQQRNIPDVNRIEIDAPTEEEITPAEFEIMQQKIEAYLSSNGLVDQLNYLVTTKDVPLSVFQDTCNNINAISACAAVDSELSLLFSDDSDQIGTPGSAINPFFDTGAHFSRDQFGIYLVTRLDGYTKDDVINLIDRSGPHTPVNQETSLSVLDISSVDTFILDFMYSEFIEETQNQMLNDGWPVIYHPDSTILLDQQKVFCYVSINAPTENTDLNFQWERGSITSSIFAIRARSFDFNQNVNNEIWLADMIRDGATGAHGLINYNFISTSLRNNILFDYYTNPNDTFNLAESYFMSLPRLSWQDVIIGDPKTSIVIDNTLSYGDPQLTNQISIFPNPNLGQFVVQNDDIEIQQINVLNQLGQLIYTETPQGESLTTPIDISQQSAGVYYIQLKTKEGDLVEKILVGQK